MSLTNDLIDMEGEFRILNKEIESKTMELLKKADDIVKNQEQSMKDLVTPDVSSRDIQKDMTKKFLSSNISEGAQNSDWYMDNMDSIDSTFSYKSLDSDDDISVKNLKDIRRSKDRIQNLMLKKEQMKNKHFSELIMKKCESIPSVKEYFNVLKKLSCYEMENIQDYEDVSENDEVDNMLKILEGQKDFNKSVTSLMKTKESIRNKEHNDIKMEGSSYTKIISNRFSLPQMNGPNIDTLSTIRKNKSDIINREENTKPLQEKELFTNKEKNPHEDVIIKAMKSKIKLLQDDLQKSNENLKKKIAEQEMTQKTNQSLVENKLKLLSQVNALRNQTIKLETKVSGLTSKLQAKENECKSLSSEKETVSKSLKEVTQNNSSAEVRLARAREEITTLKEQLSFAKVSEKEIRESSKHQIEEMSQNLSRAERRARNGIVAVRKQAQLIDNLRRQVALLAAGKEIKTIEGQLDNLLQWNI